MSDNAPTAAELLSDVEAALLRAPGQSATLVLPRGHVFVVLQRGHRPSIIPIYAPGRWGIRADSFGDKPGALPCLIAVVPYAQRDAWIALTDPVIDETIAKAIAVHAAGAGPAPGTRLH
jgi:hypothetical protein